MKTTLFNDKIVIEDPTPVIVSTLKEHLSYTDKAKQFQMRRMQAHPFHRDSKKFQQVKSEVHGCLVEESGNTITIPSGFVHLLNHYEDHRCETGDDIPLPWKNRPFDPRPYQEEALELMENNYRGLINFATGLGKTLTAVYAIRKFRKKALVLCPNIGIAEMFYEELTNAFDDRRIGFLGDGKNKIKDITVGVVGTVVNRLDKLKTHGLGLIIVDEAHHIPARTFFSITSALGDTGRIFGLTATDFRGDGLDPLITAGVGPTLIKRDLVWGIREGWLANPHFIIRNVPTRGRNIKNDKLKNYKGHVLNDDNMNERLIDDAKNILKTGKSILILVSEKAHGYMLAKELKLPFAVGDDKLSGQHVKDLNDGRIPGLIGTASKIGEGVDTRRVDVLQLANFVASKGPLWQNLGRGLRIYGNKKNLLVLDYCPTGSDMLTRHCKQRISFYKEITHNIKVI